jgi:SPFH domain/Band 7 family protein
MINLVNEVLQAAVGNHFRDKLQVMPAIKFIQTRPEVQKEAEEYISRHLLQYQVETKGVYIQDVVFPEDLVKVLTDREIATQETQTFEQQQKAQLRRVEMERAKGTADMQAELAKSQVGVDIKSNNAAARKVEAEGEAAYIRETGTARGAEVRAVGLARAEAYEAQVRALGHTATAAVNSIDALSRINVRFVPDVLVTGGNGTGSFEGLAATLTGLLNVRSGTLTTNPAPEIASKSSVVDSLEPKK